MGSSKSGKVKETSYQKAEGQIAKERYADYQKYYQPQETAFIREVDSELPGLREKAQGLAATDNAQRFTQAREHVEQSLASRGIGLGSGRSIGALGGLAQDQTSARASNVAGAGTASLTQHLGNLQNLVQAGSGHSADALQGLSNLANISGNQALIDARASAAARQALGQTIGSAVGTGIGMYNDNQLQTQKYRPGGAYYLGDPNTAQNYFSSSEFNAPFRGLKVDQNMTIPDIVFGANSTFGGR